METSSTVSQTSSKDTVGSVFLFIVAVLSILAAVALGFGSWGFFIRDVEFGGFWFVGAFALGFATLLCATLPCSVLLRRTRNSRYRLSLRLSVVTLTLIAVEAIAVIFFHH